MRKTTEFEGQITEIYAAYFNRKRGAWKQNLKNIEPDGDRFCGVCWFGV